MRSIRFETQSVTATDYVVGRGALGDRRVHEALAAGPLAVVVDEEVLARHRPAVDQLLAGHACLGLMAVCGGEQAKSFAQLGVVLDFLEQVGLPKHGVVLTIGGGTISDVVGLAALLIRRSVDLVLIPTTLLSQVDAAVGGKNGVNTPETKNLIGHFHHPVVVACDQVFLDTLPSRQVVSGLAECLKVFAVADPVALVAHERAWSIEGSPLAWDDLVWDAVRGKLRLLAEDPYEASSRRLLNYGHAFAHSFEERSAYRLLHGEAVLLGILVENEISQVLDLAEPVIEQMQDTTAALVPAIGRACWISFAELGDELVRLRRMRRDALNLVCLRRPGAATFVDDIPEEVLAQAWIRLERRLDLDRSVPVEVVDR